MNEKSYTCFLNGQLYGSGNLRYIHELFHDYVIKMQMHGADEIDFRIVERSKLSKLMIKESVEENEELLKRLTDS